MREKPTIRLDTIARSAAVKYGFRPEFPPAVTSEISRMHERVYPGLPGDTTDMREMPWSSIDNWDSEDLDQLEYCEEVGGGQIRVRVAVADVDMYVRQESETDLHAAHNGTSVYTGVVTFPLLPDRLSKGITSLLPGHDRMAMVVEYLVLPDGSIRPGGIQRARVLNKAKLVYEDVGDWLEGNGPEPAGISGVPGMERQVRLQSSTAQKMRKHRMDQGALDLETIEARPVMENNQVTELAVQKPNHARSIIEEFMVAANATMVHLLGAHQIPMIQRVVRVPKNWDAIVAVAAGYDTRLPAEPDALALSGFLASRKDADPVRFPDLSLTIIKLLGPGEYLPLNPGDPPYGHFSMAITDYTHGTAPNRRYVDIINQRLLKSALDNAPAPYSPMDLARHSAWLTDREKAEKKVERFMVKAAAAVLLRDRIGEMFDGLVTGVKDTGCYARIISPPVEGRVMRGEKGLRVGQNIRVRLLKTDPYNGYIDFERVL